MDNLCYPRKFTTTKVIKKTVFLLLLLIGFVFLPNKLIAQQQTTVTISATNENLQSVFDKVEKNTIYRFTYIDVILPNDKNITISASSMNIEDFMNKILSSTTLAYKRNGNTFSITQKLQKTESWIELTGIIVDEKDNPLIGAVVAENTSNAVTTDIDGQFTLTVPLNSILKISYLGYFPQEIKVEGTKNIRIKLIENTQILEEVVVVGYGTMNRKNLSTAISTIKTENISKASISNTSQMLLGRAAGLRATVNSPQPGGALDISIRGAGTPIYIVDGVVMPSGSLEVGSGQAYVPNYINRSGLAGLNPNDIESIEVLKDASAAIYGIDAANGVILISTKQGIEGRPKITFDSNWSVVKNYPYPDMLNAQEYMNMANIFSKENYLLNKEMYPYGNTPYDSNWLPLFSPKQIAEAQTHDWKEYVLKTGSIINQNITISGGTKTLKYYLSGNYYNYDGSVSNAKMERFALRTNVSAQLLPFLKLTSIININQNKYINSTVGTGAVGRDAHGAGALTAALTYPSFLPLHDTNGNYTIYQNYPNPDALNSISDRTKTTGWYVNFTADVDIIKDILSVKLLYGNNTENGNRQLYVPSDLYFAQMYLSRGHYGNNQRINQTLEATASFKKNFDDWLQVDAVAGIGQYFDAYDILEVYYENANDIINNTNIGAADGPFYPSSGKSRSEKRSQFARVSFDMFDKYVLSATLRRDGTDKFFPDRKYVLFPSVSTAWKLSNESFMKDIEWINLLKIRASYGKTGRDNLGTSVYGTLAPSDWSVSFSNNSVSYIPYLESSLNYPDVSWEKTTKKNIGIDFSLLRDRISGSFDWYRDDITDLLGSATTSQLAMLGTRPINYGHYIRTGWDASLNTVNINTPDFKWTSALTFTRYNSIWKQRMLNYHYQEYQIRENEPMNANYYYKTTGVINMDRSNMPESQRSLPIGAQLPGYDIIEDKNSDGQITIDDIYMENVVPDIYIGLGNTFYYKNFDLNIHMYGQFGVTRYNYVNEWAMAGTLILAPTPPNHSTMSFDVWNSQTNPNGRLSGVAGMRTIPLPGNVGTNVSREDASFLRVQNITLGYTLDRNKLGSIGNYISSIRIAADAQNPFVFTKFSIFDPEINTGGNGSLSKAEYPQTRIFSLSAKIIF